jgi:hypothetical protein
MEDELLALEDEGWRALSSESGAGFYERHLAEDAAMIFPFGVMDRSATIEAIAGAPPWQSYAIQDARVITLDENSAVVVYRATAQRAGQPEYRALMSSTYVRRNGDWKLALHQQTPLGT